LWYQFVCTPAPIVVSGKVMKSTTYIYSSY